MRVVRYATSIRNGAALCLAAVLASACAGNHPSLPPPIASQEELTAKKKASVVFATQISDAIKIPMCASASATLVKFEKPLQIDFPFSEVVVADVGHNTHLFLAELDPGRYALQQFVCQNFGQYSHSYVYTTESIPFATFEVKAGEVIDAGTVHVNMWHPNKSIISKGDPPIASVFVGDTPEHHRPMALPEALRSKVEVRLMQTRLTPSQERIAKSCAEQRLYRSTSGLIASAISVFQLQTDAPICSFVTAEKK